MALIKCSDCGREISDKAAACIHCGCPVSASVASSASSAASAAPAVEKSLSLSFNAMVSGPDNGKSSQRVYVAELGRQVEFSINNDTRPGETIKVNLAEGSKYDYIIFTAASVKRVSASEADPSSDNKTLIDLVKSYKPNLLVRFFKSGFLRKLVSMLLTFIIVGRFGDVDLEVLIPIFAVCFVLLLIGSSYPLANIKRYFKRHGIDAGIRRDGGYMNLSVCAYNLLPSKKMLSYIDKLNPKAANEIRRQLESKK